MRVKSWLLCAAYLCFAVSCSCAATFAIKDGNVVQITSQGPVMIVNCNHAAYAVSDLGDGRLAVMFGNDNVSNVELVDYKGNSMHMSLQIYARVNKVTASHGELQVYCANGEIKKYDSMGKPIVASSGQAPADGKLSYKLVYGSHVALINSSGREVGRLAGLARPTDMSISAVDNSVWVVEGQGLYKFHASTQVMLARYSDFGGELTNVEVDDGARCVYIEIVPNRRLRLNYFGVPF